MADGGANTGRRGGLQGLGVFALAPWLTPFALLGGCSTASSGPSSAPWPQPVPRSGSGSTATPPPTPGGTTPIGGEVSPGAAPPITTPPIVTERRWLEEWFGKTPVVISQPSDNALQLSVPMVNSFEPGQLVPRAALAAVLDRLADSLRRQPNTRLVVVAAPDVAASPAQAATRAQRMVEHLIARRVMPQRITTPRTGASGAPVLLQLQFLPAPIL